jgi:hypothetical protein
MVEMFWLLCLALMHHNIKSPVVLLNSKDTLTESQRRVKLDDE